MSRSIRICLQALFAPVRFWQSRGGGPPDRVAPPAVDGPMPAERLERVAMYARAGYFHMGYTLDTINMAGEIPPE